MRESILVINIGSSSIKFSLFETAADQSLSADAHGRIEATGGPRISLPSSTVSAWVVPAGENLMIARHTRRLLDGRGTPRRERNPE